MPGKRTDKTLHQSRAGEIVASFQFKPGQVEKLSQALRDSDLRPLTPDEIDELREALENWRERRAAVKSFVTSDIYDQRRTLAGIANLKNDAEVLKSFSNCDHTTENFIILALYKYGVKRFDSLQASSIRAAAKRAHDDLRPGCTSGGRPKSQYLEDFVYFCIGQWYRRGGKLESPSWQTFDKYAAIKMSPLRAWVNGLLVCLEGRVVDEKTVRQLIKSARERYFSLKN